MSSDPQVGQLRSSFIQSFLCRDRRSIVLFFSALYKKALPTYETPTGTIVYTNPFTVFNIKELLEGKEVPLERIEVTGTGQLVTPFANFRLLQPVGLNNSAVEVDGISFETVIPEPLLTLQNQSDNSYQSVQIGMRITNNTLTPFHFSFYGTFTPELVMPDGQVKWSDYATDWIRGPEESDFLLVTPGKSLTFFPDIAILIDL